MNLKNIRKAYRSRAQRLARWQKALFMSEATFRNVVLHDHFGRRRDLRPSSDGIAYRTAKAVGWLLRAHDATDDDGVSYGYFPIANNSAWEPSYPETTGYIMTSPLAYARLVEQPALVDRVERMAHWEAALQLPSGAVQGGKVASKSQQKPAAFNTGMVLDGFVSLLEYRPDNTIADAAGRAAAFLIADLTENGLFVTNGPAVSPGEIKLYNVLCAWSLYRYGLLNGELAPRAAALRAVEKALSFQSANGWFAENCLTDSSRPLTHTIGYTLQGLLEVAVLDGREDILAAVERGFAPAVAAMEPDGYLAGRFNADWRPASPTSCLTGSAQLAIIGFRLAALGRSERYGAAADKLVDFLKSLQRLDTGNADIDGALAGSYPILGRYMPGGYPNWATKYLLDALMMQAERSGVKLGPDTVNIQCQV